MSLAASVCRSGGEDVPRQPRNMAPGPNHCIPSLLRHFYPWLAHFSFGFRLVETSLRDTHERLHGYLTHLRLDLTPCVGFSIGGIFKLASTFHDDSVPKSGQLIAFWLDEANGWG